MTVLPELLPMSIEMAKVRGHAGGGGARLQRSRAQECGAWCHRLRAACLQL